MNLQEAPAASRWLAAVRTLTGTLPRKLTTSDLNALSEQITSLAWRTDRPNVDAVFRKIPANSYQRHLVAGGDNGHSSALLIAWPPNHQTPLHDHGGLWGIELVLDGVLAVKEYQVGSDQRPVELRLQRTQILGVGDAAVFSGRDYVHACRNLSPNRPALSLHVYGGALKTYATFSADEFGYYQPSPQQARLDAVTI